MSINDISTDAKAVTEGAAPGSSKLRVGVMLDSTTVTAWEYKVLTDIVNSDIAQLSLVVLNQVSEQKPLTRWQRLKLVWPNLIYSLYLKLDYKLCRRRVNLDAFATVDASQLMAGVPHLKVLPERKKFTDRFAPADIDAIRTADLDVMIRFGFRIIRGDILDVAKHGVWSMHHGDNDEYRGGPAHFWEIYEDNPLTGVVMQVLSDELDAGYVIYRSWGRTNPHSLFLNRNAAYWKASDFYIRRLRQVHQRGGEFLKALDDGDAPRPVYRKPIYRNPSNLTMLKYLWRVSSRWARGWLRRKWTREAWFLAWRNRDAEVIGIETGHLRKLEAPKDRYYADPFIISHAGQDWLFFEDYPYSTGKGVISCVSLSPDGTPAGEVRRVLDRPYHLSFPFMMHGAAGELYMIPETRGNRCIERFKCTRFPDEWTPECLLMANVSAADTALFEHDGLWWMFTNTVVPGAAGDDELSLFYSEYPEGPWSPHPLNPVVSDVRRARMAGAVFIMEADLIRPAQDGTRGYGAGVVFHRIDTLTLTDYRETVIHRITTAGITGNVGTHTYNRNERFEIIDGRYLKPKWK